MAFDINKIESVQFNDTYFPTVDGVVRTVHSYATLLNRDSYTCVVAPYQGKHNDDTYPYDIFRAKSVNIPVAEYRLPVASISSSLKKAFDSHNFQIFHCHSPFFLGHYAVKEGHRRGIKVIGTFHSKFYDDALKITGSERAARFVANYVVKFFNSCDSVWACSEGTADTLRTYGYKGDIFVMDNGTEFVYPKNPQALEQMARQYFKLEKGVPTILFVGHQIWQKNLKLVLDTAAVFRARGVKFRLIIAGSGYAEKEIKKYADSLHLLGEGTGVDFVGQINNRSLLQGLEISSDILFFPSVYDNAPLVVREAAAMKLPSLLMEGSNAAEPVTDGVNGYICNDDPVKTADKIMQIISNKDAKEIVGKNASETLGKNWTEIIPKVREKYAEIINGL